MTARKDWLYLTIGGCMRKEYYICAACNWIYKTDDNKGCPKCDYSCGSYKAKDVYPEEYRRYYKTQLRYYSSNIHNRSNLKKLYRYEDEYRTNKQYNLITYYILYETDKTYMAFSDDYKFGQKIKRDCSLNIFGGYLLRAIGYNNLALFVSF